MTKRKLISFMLSSILAIGLLSGCGSGEDTSTEEIDMSTEQDYDTPADTAPITYASEANLPDDMFYIKHKQKKKDKNGKTKEITYYYQVHAAEHNFDGAPTAPMGADPSRIEWVNYNIDEGQIPTCYPGDSIIYKSSSVMPTIYYWEKFFDDGYTFGVAGLKADLSGNYKYDSENGSLTMSSSDATGFDALDAESIYLVSAGNKRITSKNVSDAGIVTGLELMHAYKCDIRTGTERIDAILTANIHCFSSAENYLTSKYTFLSENIAELEIPEYLTTGYYNLNGLGMFRFLKTEDSYDNLTEKDYNETIYQYDETYGTPMGSKSGYVLDDNGILIPSDAASLLSTEEGDADYDNSAYNKDDSVVETSKTDDPVDLNGYKNAEFEISKVSDATIYDTGQYYTITATKKNSSESLSARLYIETSSSISVPEIGKSYMFSYAKSTRNDYSGYEIFSLTEVQ